MSIISGELFHFSQVEIAKYNLSENRVIFAVDMEDVHFFFLSSLNETENPLRQKAGNRRRGRR